MKNIKLTLEYDGHNFYGFQRQNSQRTVQGELERAINKITNEKNKLISAGRTDRGVHALCQVSNFTTELYLEDEKWKTILNNLLPSDIRILDARSVCNDFNARYDAKNREYEYKITSNASVFKANYYCYIKESIEEEKLETIMRPLLGRHNFKNFMVSDSKNKNTLREISDIAVIRENDEDILIRIKAPSFLRSQIRIIVGTALAIYFEKIDKNTMVDMLENCEAVYKKILAEPSGLYLSKVTYGD